MIHLAVRNAKPGMVLAEAVCNLHGTLLLKQGVELTLRNVMMLKSWGIRKIFVEGEGDEDEAGDKKRSDSDVAETMRGTDYEGLEGKFSDVLDDEVMVEVMRVARNRLQRRLPERKGNDETQ
ncbi:MAG: hypothetical protein JXD19_09730 [Deltaproteobacteria bacterium]|nr:hypothetical protein [Deltaproteobacteria bacterium]